MSGTERQGQYQDWIEGRGSKIMVATSAFSTGNDYPHVRLVLHLDKPFDMLDYIQGQGRAGRDGK
ncbi:P-loop containing nucleoside triphosphate hydrolase protein, partial [Pisolithus thermaeus]